MAARARLVRLVPVLVVLGAAAWWLHVHRPLPWVLSGGDGTEYADVARHLARGQGFTTGIVYPAGLAWGVGPGHPSIVRPPAWPLAIAAAFALAGPADWAVHAMGLAFHLATVAATMALAAALAGPPLGVWVGAAAGVATATSWPVLSSSFFGGTEPAFAFFTVLAFLLLARARRPFWIGLACGLAYLTRYNGLVLLPIAMALLVRRRTPLRPPAWCAAGFLAVVLPWWARNVAVAGDPLFTLYNLLPWANPGVTSYTQTLLHMIRPDRSSRFAMAPLEKLRTQLLPILLLWPPASANLAALAGVVLACVRRDRLALGWLALAAATTLSVALAFGRGRYFAPLVPPMIAIGAAAWARHGGRLRLPALVLILVAPLLPAVPPEAIDFTVFRLVATQGERIRARREHPPWAPCLTRPALVLAEDAPLVNWVTDDVTIWLPATPEDALEIVDRWPVGFLQVDRRRDVLTPVMLERFAPTACPTLYERRPTAPPS